MKIRWFAPILVLSLTTIPFTGSLFAAPAGTGSLYVSFLYNAPTTAEIEPTYHTAIWLADKDGHLLKTLYVSSELSGINYKFGYACPDWVKQSNWEKAGKSVVDAVTGPTPNVGNGEMAFDLDQLGIKPGTYQLCFQVHISDKYNVLFRGTFVAGGAKKQEIRYETLFSPSKVAGGEDLVKEVMMEFRPAEAKK